MKSRTIYLPVEEINETQKKVFQFIKYWVKTENTPIPHSEILKAMGKEMFPDITTVGAITALLHKGYIRKAVITSNKRYYVMLRS